MPSKATSVVLQTSCTLLGPSGTHLDRLGFSGPDPPMAPVKKLSSQGLGGILQVSASLLHLMSRPEARSLLAVLPQGFVGLTLESSL